MGSRGVLKIQNESLRRHIVTRGLIKPTYDMGLTQTFPVKYIQRLIPRRKHVEDHNRTKNVTYSLDWPWNWVTRNNILIAAMQYRSSHVITKIAWEITSKQCNPCNQATCKCAHIPNSCIDSYVHYCQDSFNECRSHAGLLLWLVQTISTRIKYALMRCQHDASTTPHGPKIRRNARETCHNNHPSRTRCNRFDWFQKNIPYKTYDSFWHSASQTPGLRQCGRRTGNNIFQDILQQGRRVAEPTHQYKSTQRCEAARQQNGSWKAPLRQTWTG